MYEHWSIIVPPPGLMSSDLLLMLTPPRSLTASAFGYSVQLPAVRLTTAGVGEPAALGDAEVVATPVGRPALGEFFGPHPLNNADVTARPIVVTIAIDLTVIPLPPRRLSDLAAIRAATPGQS